MQTPTDAPHGREHLSHALSPHPDARLLAFGQLWESTGAEVEALERQGAAPQKIDDMILRKMALAAAVDRAPCHSLDGLRFVLSVALDGARIQHGDELDENWLLVAKALETLRQLPA